MTFTVNARTHVLSRTCREHLRHIPTLATHKQKDGTVSGRCRKGCRHSGADPALVPRASRGSPVSVPLPLSVKSVCFAAWNLVYNLYALVWTIMNVFARIIMLSYFASFFQSLRHQKSSQIGTLVKRFCSLQRIERIISNRGIGSRTEVSKLLKQGRVSCNGKIVKSGSIRFHKYVDIRIDGNPILHVRHKILHLDNFTIFLNYSHTCCRPRYLPFTINLWAY